MKYLGLSLALVASGASAWNNSPEYSCGSHYCVPGQRMEGRCADYTTNFNSIVLPEASATAAARMKHLLVCVAVGAAVAGTAYVATSDGDTSADGLRTPAWQAWRQAASRSHGDPPCRTDALITYLNGYDVHHATHDGDLYTKRERRMPARCVALSKAYKGLGRDELSVLPVQETFSRVMPDIGRVSLTRWIDPDDPPSAGAVTGWFNAAKDDFRKANDARGGKGR